MEGVLNLHEVGNLGSRHRLPVWAVLAHVKLDNDGFQVLPSLLVGDVKTFRIVGGGKQLCDVHDDSERN